MPEIPGVCKSRNIRISFFASSNRCCLNLQGGDVILYNKKSPQKKYHYRLVNIIIKGLCKNYHLKERNLLKLVLIRNNFN